MVRQVYPWQSSLFLTFIYAGIQVHKKLKARPWYAFLQNLRSALGTKTQGPPLVRTPKKPKASPWFGHMQQLQQPSWRVQSSIKQTTTTLFGKTFNQVKVILTPHNHQRRSYAGQDDPSLDCMTRPSIKCNSYLFLITIRGRTLKVKQPTPTLVGKTFNQGQVKHTPHNH